MRIGGNTWGTSGSLSNIPPTCQGFIMLNNTCLKLFWISGGGFTISNVFGNYGTVTYSNNTITVTNSSATTITIVAFYM